MSESPLSHLQSEGDLARRKIITVVSGFGIVCGLGSGSALAQNGSNQSSQDNANTPTTSITLTVVAPIAWEVVSVDGSYADATDEENPTITLREGVRYTIKNEYENRHPLSLRDASGNALLSQLRSGSYEDNEPVDWEETDSTVSFTLTSELADDLSSYICTRHSSMEGNIKIAETETNSTAETETNSTAETETNSTAETETNSTAETETNSTAETETNSTAETGETNVNRSNVSESRDEDGTTKSEVPGFGITGSIIGVGGAGYILKSKMLNKENKENEQFG